MDLFEFLAKRSASANTLNRQTGYSRAPLGGLTFGGSLFFAGIYALGWAAGMPGLLVMVYFLYAFHRRESYALANNRPELLLDSRTMVTLKQLEVVGQSRIPVASTDLPVPKMLNQVREYIRQIKPEEVRPDALPHSPADHKPEEGG